MQRLDLGRLEAGMVLAEPVTGKSGALLAPAGAKLTPHMIAAFAHQSVVNAAVQGGAAAAGGSTLKHRLQELETRFQGHADDAFMGRLKAMFVSAYREREMAQREETREEETHAVSD